MLCTIPLFSLHLLSFLVIFIDIKKISIFSIFQKLSNPLKHSFHCIQKQKNMGYDTCFDGFFQTDKVVDEETYQLLRGLATTRRLKRVGLDPKFGRDGEFYVGDDERSIVDCNTPPETQPGLWCQWLVQDDHRTLKWDGGEKFYRFIDWIEYIIIKILKPRGYMLSGTVGWCGEDEGDRGEIIITDNNIRTRLM
jgi:hypothetical protein